MLNSDFLQAEATQHDRLVEVGTAAFLNDPMMRYLQPDDERHEQFVRWMSNKVVRYGRMYGRVYCDRNADGLAVWLVPGQTTISPWRMLRSGFMTLPFRFGMGVMSRFNALDAQLKKIHKEATPGDHWYLLYLAVAPDRQGSGIGTSLIQSGASQADEAKLPCYLETETEENVAYYEKRGFEVVGEHKFNDALTMWGMRRNPA